MVGKREEGVGAERTAAGAETGLRRPPLLVGGERGILRAGRGGRELEDDEEEEGTGGGLSTMAVGEATEE